jgi:hypothetical protein
MANLTLSIDQEEFAGLVAVGELDAAGEAGSDVELVTKRLLRSALAARLDELGLPWSPSASDVRDRVAVPPPAAVPGTPSAETAAPASSPATTPAPPRTGLAALSRRRGVRRWALSILAVTVLVLLWGGYVLRWQWTGFQANAQVWDWMRLLLLPVVVGTIPLWIERPAEVSHARRRAYWALIAAFAVFVVAGYLVPLAWTGFPGITLWDWFGLLLLPAAVASARLLPSVVGALRPHHREVLLLAAAAWAVTVIGGYGLDWKWTGYPGNTLWDWLELLLLPLVVPTILLPGALSWITGGSRARAGEAVTPAPGRRGPDQPHPRAAAAPAAPAAGAERVRTARARAAEPGTAEARPPATGPGRGPA